jgi:hypothetical protein
MLSSNYIKSKGVKLLRTKTDNFIKLFKVNTISSVVKDKTDIYDFRVYNHTGDTFSYQDYLLMVKTSAGKASCGIYFNGVEYGKDITLKVLKDNESFIVCCTGANVWQDITCQIRYSTNPINVDYLLNDDYIFTSEMDKYETYNPSELSNVDKVFTPTSKIFVDTASYHNDIDVKLILDILS